MVASAVITGAFALGKKLLDLGDQYIEDKDKRAEYAFHVAEMANEFSTQVLTTTTNPKVDATVKILYAIRDVVIPLLRPLGGAAITAFGLYAHHKQIPIDPVIHGTLDAAFPGWMAGRQMDKHVKQREETRRHIVTERRKAKSDDYDFPTD